MNPNDLLFSCEIERPGAFKKLINEMSTYTTTFEFNVTNIGIQFLHEELSTEGFSYGKLPKENFGNNWFLFFPSIISSSHNNSTNTSDNVTHNVHFLSDPNSVTLNHLDDQIQKTTGCVVEEDIACLFFSKDNQPFYSFSISIVPFTLQMQNLTDKCSLLIQYYKTYPLILFITTKSTGIESVWKAPIIQHNHAELHVIPDFSMDLMILIDAHKFHKRIAKHSAAETPFINITFSIDQVVVSWQSRSGTFNVTLKPVKDNSIPTIQLPIGNEDSDNSHYIDNPKRIISNDFNTTLLQSYLKAHKVSKTCYMSMNQDMLIMKFPIKDSNHVLGDIYFALSPFTHLTCAQQSLIQLPFQLKNNSEHPILIIEPHKSMLPDTDNSLPQVTHVTKKQKPSHQNSHNIDVNCPTLNRDVSVIEKEYNDSLDHPIDPQRLHYSEVIKSKLLKQNKKDIIEHEHKRKRQRKSKTQSSEVEVSKTLIEKPKRVRRTKRELLLQQQEILSLKTHALLMPESPVIKVAQVSPPVEITPTLSGKTLKNVIVDEDSHTQDWDTYSVADSQHKSDSHDDSQGEADFFDYDEDENHSNHEDAFDN